MAAARLQLDTLSNNVVVGESLMETEDLQSRKYNRRTLRDEHGQYPVWMNQRSIQKRKKAGSVCKRAKFKCGSRKKSRK